MSPAQELPPANTVTLIDELLAEQRSLTAVERFSRQHETVASPAQARYYRDLLPLTRPRPGEQYAFEVDLDQCTGCKGCVTACHALNGLEDGEAWRNVGLLVGGINGHAQQQTVTTACHHCVDPGCLNGCPVLAYDKDPLTGIVRHLDDQCIGCQYCVMKCPYDVPKFSARLGIVRKCDLCHQRLAVGEAPACVQACPNEAIKISLVEQQSIRRTYRESLTEPSAGNRFLAASPDPDYTLPTTRYRSARPLVASLNAADESALRTQAAHGPLIFLLVLSQASVGFAIAGGMELLTRQSRLTAVLMPLAAGAMIVALGIAGLHLGRPLKAWRAFLGWRTSWFSREAIAFGGYLTAVIAAAGATLLAPGRTGLLLALTTSAVVSGLAAVFCSLMLYVDTRREFWSARQGGIRFVGTMCLLGLAGWIAAGAFSKPVPRAALFALILLIPIKLVLELAVLRHGESREWTPLKRTARLLTGPLRFGLWGRLTVAVAGGIALPALAIAGLFEPGPVAMLTVFGLVLAGELLERYLFFTAVSPQQMPGGLAT